jgi:hypothetical protein
MQDVIVFIVVMFGVPLLFWALGSVPEPKSSDDNAVARHKHAQEEIRMIGTLTRQLMRAAATTKLPHDAAVAVTPPPAVPMQPTPVTHGFVWTPSTLASSSSSPDHATFYMPFIPQ